MILVHNNFDSWSWDEVNDSYFPFHLQHKASLLYGIVNEKGRIILFFIDNVVSLLLVSFN